MSVLGFSTRVVRINVTERFNFLAAKFSCRYHGTLHNDFLFPGFKCLPRERLTQKGGEI